jgi:membrane protease YdiL (CAAX protease family)
MNVKSKKTLGITMLCELMLFCAYAVIISLTRSIFDQMSALMVSSVLILPVYLLPVFIYLKLSKISLCEILNPSTDKPNDRTRNFKFTVLSFVIAASMTVVAVNLISIATDTVFNFFGAPQAPNEAYNTAELFLIFIRNVLFASVIEELLLRGVVLHATNELSFWKRVLLSALLFALIHCSLRRFFYAFAAGAVITFFVLKTGSVLFGIALHFFQNSVSFGFNILKIHFNESICSLVANITFAVLLVVALSGIVLMIVERRISKSIAPVTRNTSKSESSGREFSTELLVFIIAAAIVTAVNF